jgi:hypothetical protein
MPGLGFLVDLGDETVLAARLHDVIPQGRCLGSREKEERLGRKGGETILPDTFLSARPAPDKAAVGRQDQDKRIA